MSELIPSPHSGLRDFTSARVALRTTGHSLAISEVLAFQLAHALARDAVHASLDLESFAARLRDVTSLPTLQLRSSAPDRVTYLRRPDLGRMLHPDSAGLLHGGECDLAIVVADGLSALAVERNAIPLLAHLLPQLGAAGWSVGLIALVRQGRVAIGDPIGAALGARLSLVLIGERPGLSSCDSLGAYLTWRPGPGRTDAERNCISNIHEGGLAAEAATARIFWYLNAARAGQISGTALKDGSNQLAP
jgi:ethanolamine ammonia-lyase small subunit